LFLIHEIRRRFDEADARFDRLFARLQQPARGSSLSSYNVASAPTASSSPRSSSLPTRERDFEFSIAFPFAPAPDADFSFTDGATTSTKSSSDVPAIHAKFDTFEQEVHSVENTLHEGDLFLDTTKQIDPADCKELASLGNNDSRVHSTDSDDFVFPLYTQTATLVGEHVRWWPAGRTTE
jgi:hypothetical protein